MKTVSCVNRSWLYVNIQFKSKPCPFYIFSIQIIWVGQIFLKIGRILGDTWPRTENFGNSDHLSATLSNVYIISLGGHYLSNKDIHLPAEALIMSIILIYNLNTSIPLSFDLSVSLSLSLCLSFCVSLSLFICLSFSLSLCLSHQNYFLFLFWVSQDV